MKALASAKSEAKPQWTNGLGLLAIHVGALLALWPGFFSWGAVVAAVILAYLTGALGVTLNYHRTLTHRSLRMIKPLEYVTAILGALAMQGDPIKWVAIHRMHHAHSDHRGDPHTTRRGLTWAHLLWIFRTNEHVPDDNDMKRYCPDIYADTFYRALGHSHLALQLLLAVALFFMGGWSFVIWGIFVRLVFTYHTTWLVNSASHAAGYRTYRTSDRSTNSWWVALVSFGEGWHNNHHAFPFSARHGMAWWELDLTWWHIKLLRALRMVDRVRVPTAEMRERLRLGLTRKDRGLA
jgi:stearoyl-CoA desaturase (delta-9 desaturase)